VARSTLTKRLLSFTLDAIVSIGPRIMSFPVLGVGVPHRCCCLRYEVA
jgi:hypothetical protein